MHVFDVLVGGGRDDDAVLSESFQLAAGHARKANRRQTTLVRGLERAQDVGRIPARADGERHIAGVGERNQRLGKNRFVPVVIRIRGKDRHVVVQAGNLKTRHVRAHGVFSQICRKMGRGAGAAAVTEYKNVAAFHTGAFENVQNDGERIRRSLVEKRMLRLEIRLERVHCKIISHVLLDARNPRGFFPYIIPL